MNMRTIEKYSKNDQEHVISRGRLIQFFTCLEDRIAGITAATMIITFSSLFAQCTKDDAGTADNDNSAKDDQYTIDQTISDEAQRNTLSFDGLAFLTGNVGSQSFLPPGKVADYSGFQYLRDNDPTSLGHNTSFVTIIAYNILDILTTDQVNIFVDRAQNQIDLINQFAYYRFPLLKAFRRLKEGDLPVGTTELNKEAVIQYTAELYRIDGRISYDRAQLFEEVISSLSSAQKAKIEALKKLNGVGNWDSTISNPLEGLNLPKDISVAVMTYASEIYAWYTGTVTSDVYFCPERQGTYFGSFYLKDWPAMGNPNYTINEQLTATAGQDFLNILSVSQSDQVKGVVDLQRSALLELVEKRELISTELRKFLSSQTADSSSVLALSERYGELDGEISFYYATVFSQVYNSFSDDQKTQIIGLAENLGYIDPDGAFLYSQAVAMPEIINTDFMFK
jgi:hypothetical protein